MKQRNIYKQTDLPVFQNRLYKSAEEGQNSPTGDINLVQDNTTGLIYNANFKSHLLQYDTSYNNDQSCSPTFKKHMKEVADLLTSKMGKKKLIEIGCGKGTFLELLLSHGADIIGFDPAYEGCNPLIKREYFSEDTKIKGKGIILRHVLEHIQNPVKFLYTLAKANGGSGLIYIEVPCLDWITENRAWFDIFYEHVNYFRLKDFSNIFKNVIYSGRVFGGQYISIVADLSSLKQPKFDPKEAFDFPKDFAKISIPNSFSGTNKKIVVWGGGSKGVIFSLLSARAGAQISHVIDINPAKQGLYLPGTGLKVVSPADGLKNLSHKSQVYVMNPNYLEEVQTIVGRNFVCKGPDYE